MFPLIYIGFISFISCFTISHLITMEYLTNPFEIETMEPKKDSRVRFNTEIRFKASMPISSLSSHTIDQLWYNKNDYDKFKNDFIKFKRYNSI